MRGALEIYEQGLRQRTGVQVRFEDGTLAPLPLSLYLAPADRADTALLADVAGPVLDVGCGPGRHLRALTAAGVYALGVDLSPVAVEFACRDGARAIVGDVFGDVPGAGGWATALLLDGNIGIGGRPRRLLRRLRSLLRADGVVLAELEPPDAATRTTRARIETPEGSSHWFPWGRVSASEIATLAMLAGMTAEETWQCGERWFARLAPA